MVRYIGLGMMLIFQVCTFCEDKQIQNDPQRIIFSLMGIGYPRFVIGKTSYPSGRQTDSLIRDTLTTKSIWNYVDRGCNSCVIAYNWDGNSKLGSIAIFFKNGFDLCQFKNAAVCFGFKSDSSGDLRWKESETKELIVSFRDKEGYYTQFSEKVALKYSWNTEGMKIIEIFRLLRRKAELYRIE